MITFKNASPYNVAIALSPLQNATLRYDTLVSVPQNTSHTFTFPDNYANLFVLQGSSLLWKGSIPCVGTVEFDGTNVRSEGSILPSSFSPVTCGHEAISNTTTGQKQSAFGFGWITLLIILLIGGFGYVFLR